MIRNSLLVTAALLVSYHLLLPSLPRKYAMNPNGNRDNIRRAEDYCFKHSAAPRVVVGSSMAGVLSANDLGPGYYNLAFAGGTAVMGLDVVAQSGAHPALVLIEVNALDKLEDVTLLNHLFARPLGWLRKNFRMLWDENRPVNFVVGIPEAALRKIRKLLDWIGARPVASAAPKVREAAQLDPGLFDLVVAKAKAELEEPPEEKRLEQQLQKIERAVEFLQKRGSRCAFFEMPVHPSFTDTPRCTAIRDAARKRFGPESYPWVAPDREFRYETLDGTHLTRSGAQHYAAYLSERAQRILAQRTAPGADQRVAGGL